MSSLSSRPPHRPPSYSLRQSSRRCLEGRANNVPASSSASCVSAPILTPVMRRVSPEQAVRLCVHVNQSWTDRQTSGFPSILGGRPGVDTSCCADAMASDPRGKEQRGIGCCTHALYATEGREGGPGDLSSVPSPHAAPRRQRAYGGTGEQQRRSLCIRGMAPPGGTLAADSTPASFASRRGRPERTLLS